MIRLDPFDRDEMMAAVARRLTVFREVFQIGQKELGEAVGCLNRDTASMKRGRDCCRPRSLLRFANGIRSRWIGFTEGT